MPGERPVHGDPAACGGDCRCACGSLLARVVEGAVELKCRRCKRTHRVRLATAARPAGRVRSLPLGGAGRDRC